MSPDRRPSRPAAAASAARPGRRAARSGRPPRPSQRRRGSDPARTAAYDVLRAVAGTDSYANLVLPPLLRERRITGRDAAFATELAYGTLRLRAGTTRSSRRPPTREVDTHRRPRARRAAARRPPAARHARARARRGLRDGRAGPRAAGHRAVAVRQRRAARGRARRRRRRWAAPDRATPPETTSSPGSRSSRATRCGSSARCARRWWATVGRPTRSARCSRPTTSLRA